VYKTIIMEANIELSELMILKGGNEIVIYGFKKQDHFTYQMSWFIQNTQLNKILNHLQRENSEVEVTSLFKSCIDENGSHVMYLSAGNLNKASIPSNLILEETRRLAIRA
jgi:hypothetical protein